MSEQEPEVDPELFDDPLGHAGGEEFYDGEAVDFIKFDPELLEPVDEDGELGD